MTKKKNIALIVAAVSLIISGIFIIKKVKKIKEKSA